MISPLITACLVALLLSSNTAFKFASQSALELKVQAQDVQSLMAHTHLKEEGNDDHESGPEDLIQELSVENTDEQMEDEECEQEPEVEEGELHQEEEEISVEQDEDSVPSSNDDEIQEEECEKDQDAEEGPEVEAMEPAKQQGEVDEDIE